MTERQQQHAALLDGDVGARGPDLRAGLAVPPEAHDVVTSRELRHVHQVLDGSVFPHVVFAKRVRKVFVRVATRVARAARAATARVTFAVVAFRANEVWHWDWA